MTKDEICFLIIILAQYLYAYSAKSGLDKGDTYAVYESTVGSYLNSIKKTSWSDYATKVIKLRNIICHDFGSDEMDKILNLINSNRKQIKLFIKYLGIIDGTSISDDNIDGKKNVVEPVSISDTDPLGDMLKGASLG